MYHLIYNAGLSSVLRNIYNKINHYYIVNNLDHLVLWWSRVKSTFEHPKTQVVNDEIRISIFRYVDVMSFRVI